MFSCQKTCKQVYQMHFKNDTDAETMTKITMIKQIFMSIFFFGNSLDQGKVEIHGKIFIRVIRFLADVPQGTSFEFKIS